ncbi:hypothetical protein KC19_10G163200 [Ceratodon purpureus]|uniref:Uncharacterized protein n=1 Tax=Ceratodon purpureus TaxID=3225 RepID=A0A8T0GRA3_CERPU|nr:hypothetical protein KC19_10G163200 [Ceratodon purpureus]
MIVLSETGQNESAKLGKTGSFRERFTVGGVRSEFCWRARVKRIEKKKPSTGIFLTQSVTNNCRIVPQGFLTEVDFTGASAWV